MWVDDNRTLIPIDQPQILASHPQTFLTAGTSPRRTRISVSAHIETGSADLATASRQP